MCRGQEHGFQKATIHKVLHKAQRRVIPVPDLQQPLQVPPLGHRAHQEDSQYPRGGRQVPEMPVYWLQVQDYKARQTGETHGRSWTRHLTHCYGQTFQHVNV